MVVEFILSSNTDKNTGLTRKGFQMERFMVYGYQEDGTRVFITSAKYAMRAESIAYEVMATNDNYSSILVWDGAFCTPYFSLDR